MSGLQRGGLRRHHRPGGDGHHRRHTYDLAGAGRRRGKLPGVPLFVVTCHVPDDPPAASPPYTFVTGGIVSAVGQSRYRPPRLGPSGG